MGRQNVVDCGSTDVVVTLADDRVETSESIDVEDLANVEGLDMVTLVSLNTTIVVTAEILTGSENIWVIGTRVAEEWLAVGCGSKTPADKDIAVLFVWIVAKLLSNIFVVEAPRGLGNVCAPPEPRDGVEFPSGGVSEVQCAV